MPSDGYEFNLHTYFPISFRYITSETNREELLALGVGKICWLGHMVYKNVNISEEIESP